MTWEDILKGNVRRRPSTDDRKDKKMSQDALFDEANRNMRKRSFLSSPDSKSYTTSFEAFRSRIMRLFPDYYDREDLNKFASSTALKNLHMKFKEIKGD
jgi:hypothetical protein